MRATFVLITGVLLLAACSSPSPPPQSPTPPAGPVSAAPPPASAPVADQAAVGAVVKQFGASMQKISTLAPPDAVRSALRDTYGGVLAPRLLEDWRAHPDQVVGREGSSPWPQRIEIDGIDCRDADACRVTGRVDYVTSNEIEHGGVFMRRGIELELARLPAGWRITAVHLAPAPG